MASAREAYEFDADTVKIAIAFGCSVLVAMTIVGAPLSIILYVGLGYGLYRRDPVYVKVSTRVVQYLPVLAVWAAVTFEVLRPYNQFDSSDQLGALGAILLVCVAAYAVEYLWLRPVTRRLALMASAGAAAIYGVKGLLLGQRSAKIMPLKFPSSFSAADEIAKWNGLRVSGAITEEEFAAAKQRLLK